MLEFEMNNVVCFKLTEYGQKTLQQEEAKLKQIMSDSDFELFSKEPGSFYCAEIWLVMKVFGKHIANGVPDIFFNGALHLKKHEERSFGSYD